MDRLCSRFIGMTPFDVLSATTEEVFDLYVDCIIHDTKEKKSGKTNNTSENVEWVNSKNASWH